MRGNNALKSLKVSCRTTRIFAVNPRGDGFLSIRHREKRPSPFSCPSKLHLRHHYRRGRNAPLSFLASLPRSPSFRISGMRRPRLSTLPNSGRNARTQRATALVVLCFRSRIIAPSFYRGISPPPSPLRTPGQRSEMMGFRGLMPPGVAAIDLVAYASLVWRHAGLPRAFAP
jgi:hypothetical protein